MFAKTKFYGILYGKRGVCILSILKFLLLISLFLGPIFFELLTIKQKERTFHTLLGQILFIFYIIVIVVYFLRQHSSRINEAYQKWKAKFTIPDSVKKWTMRILGLACLYAYIYCHHVCPKRYYRGLDTATSFFHRNFSFSLSIFVVFVLSCIIGAFIVKYISSRKLKYPKGMLGNGIFAGILPSCSCGCIPIARAMFVTGEIPIRSIVTFIMVAPVLNPFLIVFSLQLGYAFTICRVVFIFILAMITGVLVERLTVVTGAKTEGGLAAPVSACVGCNKKGLSVSGDLFIIAWDMFFSLVFYLIVGIVIGNSIIFFLPAIHINNLITSRYLGLFIVTVIALPMFVCAGQEVILLAPMMSATIMGKSFLPLGHAISFTFAGTGICISSMPLLLKVFGKKVTYIIILSFFFGSIICGILINKFIPFSGI